MFSQYILLVAIIASGLAGCEDDGRQPGSSTPQSASISLKLIKEVDGFDIPECVVIDENTGDLYVSNVATSEEDYWGDDGNGFISLLDRDGQVKELKWLADTPEMPIHSPKGMTICGGWLYFNDNASLKRVSLDGSKKVELIPLGKTKWLNDLATDGVHVWTTDTATGSVFRVDSQGTWTELKGVESINGITCWKGQVFAVSWDLHEAYELDPAAQKPAQPFGLADHFVNLDGIEVLSDGTFLISDFKGNQVVAVLPDRQTVIKLAEAESAADIGIDRKRGLLYVPLFMKNKIRIYEISRGEQ